MNKAIERFERYLRHRYGDRSTPKHYLSDMRIFVRAIGHKPPNEVTVCNSNRSLTTSRYQREPPLRPRPISGI